MQSQQNPDDAEKSLIKALGRPRALSPAQLGPNQSRIEAGVAEIWEGGHMA